MQNQSYIKFKKIKALPHLPFKGNIDITYRCNNNCCHCWLNIPANSQEKSKEISFPEIKFIIDEAKSFGCREWSISGGEPLLREDFTQIFDYITSNSRRYSINTNGTLINREIASIMKKKGNKMIALYGATEEVHDCITGKAASFKAVMKGFKYLIDEGVSFTVQIVPMKDNYHQFNDMVKLAKSLSPHYRIGAPWLYLSADKEKNNEISSQRLPPCEVFLLDTPDMNRNEYEDKISDKSDYLFSSCIKKRGEFHIDPYGKMTFCSFIKDRDLRYDLRKGSFKDCWDNFIPSLKYKIKTNNEYRENCGDCDLRKHCRWCPAYGYLEHGRYTAKVDYLCKVAKENKKFKEEWIKNHRRFYKCADITIEVDSDLPFTDNTFHDKIKVFQTDGKGNDRIKIKHSFSMPELKEDMGKEVYRKPPWAIYRKNSSWIYMSISPVKEDRNTGTVAVFNNDHTSGVIYNRSEDMFLEGSLQSLTLFPTDQLLLARILPDREGFYLHSSGVVMNGKGFAFAGHSGAGKSTMVKMLSDRAEILCDDRNIIRRHNDGFYLYGTWSHGEIPSVSPGPAPLRGIYFLEKSEENNIISLYDKKEIVKRLLPCIIKPFVTSDWWEKTLTVIEKVSSEVPCYILRFDKSGKIVEKLL